MLDVQNIKLLTISVLIATLAFGGVYANYAYSAEGVSLEVTISSVLSFSVTTDQFDAITPDATSDTYKIATSTLSVTTNNLGGWNVTLDGTDQGPANTVMDLDTDASEGLTDQEEWIPNTATSTPGNAEVRASLDSTGYVLAFRVMSASSTNGVSFLAPSWWGASDADGTATWAGIASTTILRRIGNAGVGSYSASAHLNSVQYYLDVPVGQQTGDYKGDITYTATAN